MKMKVKNNVMLHECYYLKASYRSIGAKLSRIHHLNKQSSNLQ